MNLCSASILFALSSILHVGCGTPEEAEEIQQPEVGSTSSELRAGGINFAYACVVQYGVQATVELTQPPYSNWAVTAWKCRYQGSLRGIDVNQACRDQFPFSYASYRDPHNAYSWECRY